MVPITWDGLRRTENASRVEGDTAVNWQLSLIERYAIRRRIGGIVRFPFAFAFTERVSEALGGRVLVGGGMNLALADMRIYSVMMLGRVGLVQGNILKVDMWAGV